MDRPTKGFVPPTTPTIQPEPGEPMPTRCQQHALMLGEVMQATKATAETLHEVMLQVTKSTETLIRATANMDIISRSVADLDRVVKSGNGDSLVTRTRLLEGRVDSVEGELEHGDAVLSSVLTADQKQELWRRLKTVEEWQASKDREVTQAKGAVAGGHAVLLYVVIGVGWLITTGIALYAAITGK